MDDLQFGTRNKRGDFTPSKLLEIAPFWTGKWSKLGNFLWGYVWPYNTIFMGVTLAYPQPQHNVTMADAEYAALTTDLGL